MTWGPTHLSGVSRGRAPVLLSSFTLGLALVGLLSSLLMLVGAAMIGENVALRDELSLTCTELQVGSSFAANTLLHLENAGPETASVRVDFVDGFGRGPWGVAYDRSMAPWASRDIVFRTPALEAVLVLLSSSRDLRVSAQVVRDDGAQTEPRELDQCHAEVDPVIWTRQMRRDTSL